MKINIKENNEVKMVNSSEYNYLFNKQTGLFMRWGKTKETDPVYAPFPEILDLEVSTVCSMGCKFCYKSNLSKGKNMFFDKFKQIINSFDINNTSCLTQIAFGIGDIDGNPDLFKMMEYTRQKGIVPNITINGDRLTEEIIDKLIKYCGAISVSNYGKDLCYNTIKKFNAKGFNKVNIHQLLSKETIQDCISLIDDIKTDGRLKEINAVVFLTLKKKGRGTSYNYPSIEDFTKVSNYALNSQIKFGFDSCGSGSFLKSIENHPDYEIMSKSVEPCESFGLFSSYINVDGIYFPCSFAEGVKGWEEGIKVEKNFINEVWNSEKLKEWREKSIYSTKNCNCRSKNICRKCLIYDEVNICSF